MNRYIPIILGLLLFTSACLNTPEPEEPRRVELTFAVDNLGGELQLGEESVVVNEFKFSMDRFNVIDVDSTVLQSTDGIDTFILFYTDELSEPNLVFSTSLGFANIDDFETYEFFVQPVRSSDSISDGDFLGDPDNFSFIMSGTINDQNFQFRSSPEFMKRVDFPVVRLTFETETLSIAKSIDVMQVLSSDGGATFLDPRQEENHATIDSLFNENISVSVTAEDRFQ